MGRRGARPARRRPGALGRGRSNVVARALRAVRLARSARARGGGGRTAGAMSDSHVALVGTTASGKSGLALALARRHSDIEIVSIDSMQVYRGMDIGTAKPTFEERA